MTNYTFLTAIIRNNSLKTKLTLLALTILTTGCATTSQQSSHWGYSGHEGPEYWGSLDPEYPPTTKALINRRLTLLDLLSLSYLPWKWHINLVDRK